MMKPPAPPQDKTVDALRAAYRGGRSPAFWYVWDNWQAITGNGDGLARPAWGKLAEALDAAGFKSYDRVTKQTIDYNAETTRKLFDRVKALRAAQPAAVAEPVAKATERNEGADFILAKFRENLKGDQ